ncbi:MAG: hypothetical protein Q8R28_02650 [Dehalococcoidia bacterium]|nr:hypothetical protein [Dehalococcoidia bacterium]
MEFLPLGIMGIGGTGLSAPSGPAVAVPAVQLPGEPQKFTFQSPSGAEGGRVYQVSVEVDDPQCPLDSKAAKQYWLAGPANDIFLPLVLPGNTTLGASNNADKPAKPLPQVKGAFVEFGRSQDFIEVELDPSSGWETEFTFHGNELKDRKQRFRWSTDLTTPVSATVQVGALPFPKGYEKDPLSPPGMLLSWPVDCVNCEFVVDFSQLPMPGTAKTSAATSGGAWYEMVGELVAAPVKAAGNVLADLGNALLGLFGGGSKDNAVKLTKVLLPPSKPTDYVASNKINPLVFDTFYFRAVPMKDGKAVGNGSNMVVMHWEAGEDPLKNIKFPNPTPTPVPTLSPYEVEIVSYHGIIPPVGGCAEGFGGYVVTQDTWWNGSSYTTKPQFAAPAYKKGGMICPPTEQEGKSWDEYLGEFVSGSWNWFSEAYSDLKNAVISAVGFFLPDEVCPDSCVGFLLDATLVSMGIPPDIPNLDELMDQGLDYMAQQAVAQIGIPEEVQKQIGPYANMTLNAAVDKFKDEAQAKIKDGLQQGVDQIALSYAGSGGWVPYGVPVRPDEDQPPAMTVKVTRRLFVPGGDAGCTLRVSDHLTFDKSVLDNPPLDWASELNWVNKNNQLNWMTSYDFFANEASQGSLLDRELPVPPLVKGQSVTIPMGLMPNVYQNGWYPYPSGITPISAYFTAWRMMHELGTVHLSVSGCGSAQLDIAAKANYVATKSN